MAKKKETIGQRIAKLREEQSLTRVGLAIEAGVGQATLQLIENGATLNPSKAVLVKLSKALKVSASYLLTGEENATEGSRR